VRTIRKIVEFQKGCRGVTLTDYTCHKRCGLYYIFAECLEHCSGLIVPLFSMSFRSLYVHENLPEFISAVLVPVVKNKTVGISCKGNYRYIALASIM